MLWLYLRSIFPSIYGQRVAADHLSQKDLAGLRALNKGPAVAGFCSWDLNTQPYK